MLTIDELLALSKLGVPCMPEIQVMEDGKIVGLVTETNQFVPIKKPESNFTQSIKIIEREQRLSRLRKLTWRLGYRFSVGI